jgi:hypothetical protein
MKAIGCSIIAAVAAVLVALILSGAFHHSAPHCPPSDDLCYPGTAP